MYTCIAPISFLSLSKCQIFLTRVPLQVMIVDVFGSFSVFLAEFSTGYTYIHALNLLKKTNILSRGVFFFFFFSCLV